MKKDYTVLVTRQIPEIGIQILKKHFKNIIVNTKDRNLTYEELLKAVRGVDAVLCLLSDRIDAKVIANMDKCKIISNYAVGFNNIDIDEATKRGIIVTNTPGVLTDATADLTWALILAVTRRIIEADKFVRKKKFKGWSPTLLLGTELAGKTLGIIGAGRIGTAVGLRAKGFKMKVLYYNTNKNETLEEEVGAKKVSLDTLLKNSDIITIHVPLTPQTKHLIGEREIKLMKKTSYLINTSRGEVVDEKALIKALKTKRIAGAGLDVFEQEPFVPDELLKLDNVVLTPHIGSATFEARTKMAIMAAESIVKVLSGKIPANVVNSEVLKSMR
ncbi:MAG: D-glycerate dehydrogenase [Candidatus Kryptonium sp.]|nr:D-glycerate dehydrogenase [Candidatus Kryptonium sp.]MCX7762451.1 D-glycerate dehydrogenase [Candidatus Kryptonium sp.]MDW8109589.1 D-glycerate dehydrogenase [Candidatus Kryptonium sp.]